MMEERKEQQDVLVRPGLYFLGDISHVLDSRDFQQAFEASHGFKDGPVYEFGAGLAILAFPLPDNLVSFEPDGKVAEHRCKASQNQTFYTDSGVVGLAPRRMYAEASLYQSLESYRKWGFWVEFFKPRTCYAGVTMVTFGSVNVTFDPPANWL